MKHFFLSFYITFSSLVAVAQQEYTPNFLIPFNNHGKWGWSDTLGNIKIKPEFSSANMFEDFKVFWASEVQIDKKSFSYVYGKGLLPINNTKVYHYQDKELTEQTVVITNTGKQGVYDWQKKKLILDTVIIEHSLAINQSNFIVYKDITGFYSIFDIKRNKLSRSKLDESNYDVELKATFYKKRGSADWFEINSKGEFILTQQKVQEYGFGDLQGFEGDSFYNINNFNGVDVTNFKLKVNHLPYKAIRIGEQIYLVYKLDKFFGLMTYPQLTNILEPAYDFIEIDNQHGLFHLFKDKLMGIKMVNTVYKTIEPKFDFILQFNRYYVKKSWSFCTFDVLYKGQKVSVGENGVEFFNLD